MSGKIANEFIHTNSEYEKLKKGAVGESHTPRETPSSQGPGRRGFDKQFFSEWTIEELRSYANKLGISLGHTDAKESLEANRDRLIAAIEARDATKTR